MSLSAKQQRYLTKFDKKINHLLANGGDEALIASLNDFMPKIKKMMDTIPQNELDVCCQKYTGIYHCMKLIKKIIERVEEELVPDQAMLNVRGEFKTPATEDINMAMNYGGQHMILALQKYLSDLPEDMQNEELMLRCTEALLANILNNYFEDSHEVLNQFCEHVHIALNDLNTCNKKH